MWSRVSSQAPCLKPGTGVALVLDYKTRLQRASAKGAEVTAEEAADLMPADWVRESVISPASPRRWCSDPLTQDLILIWELQRQAETTAKLPDRQGKSQKDKDTGERERIFIRLSLQDCRTWWKHQQYQQPQYKFTGDKIKKIIIIKWSEKDFKIST